MVIRFFLILLLINQAVFSNEKNLLFKMNESLKKKDYNSMIESYEDEFEIVMDNKLKLELTELYALAYESLNDYKEASNIYYEIINKYFKNKHKLIVKSIVRKKAITKALYSNRLPFIYFKLAQINMELFRMTNNFSSSSDKKLYRGRSLNYIKILRQIDYGNEDLLDDFEDVVNEKNENFKKSNYIVKNSLFTSFTSWQDTLELKAENGNTAKLINSISGTCSGWAYHKYNTYLDFFFNTCLIFATSTTAALDPTVSYKEKDVTVFGAMGGPGVGTRKFSNEVSVGVQSVYLYRRGGWTEPTDSILEDMNYIRFGYLLFSRWNLNNKVAFDIKFGKIFQNISSLWSFGVHYTY